MKRSNKLALIFNIEPGEGRMIGLLFMLYFFLGSAYSFTQAAAFPQFLLTFGARDLPWVYILNALVVSAITFFYLKLSKRVSFSTLLLGNILFLFLVICAFRLGLEIRSNQWIIFGLPVLFQLLINFGNLAFWSLAGRLLNVRQAKRLFGFIGGGQWAAIVLIGFLISPIVNLIGISNLLLIAAVSMGCALALLVTLTREFSIPLRSVEAEPPSSTSQPRTHGSLNCYILLLFCLVILWWVAYYFIDNIFYGQLAVQYPDEQSLAGFLGFYLAAQAFLILSINTFFAGPVLNRYGVRLGLGILPVVLIVFTASTAVLGTLLNAALLLFVMAVLSKLVNMALGFSVDLSAQNVMYQPLQPQQRARVKTMADGIVQPLGNGIAGLALLLLNTLLALEMVQLSYILLLVVVGWLIVVVLLNREYPGMLRKALARHYLEGVELPIADNTSITLLLQELQNPHPGIVLYGLTTLERIEPTLLRQAIPSLLKHPIPEVRKEALECIERLQIYTFVDAVREHTQQETDPTVLGASLRTLAALEGADCTDKLVPYLHDPNPQLCKGAAIGLLRSCGIAGVLAAGNALLELSNAESMDQRILAAQIIGELGLPGFYDPLIPLLHDEQLEVRRAAVLAAGQVGNAKLIPLMEQALRDPALRGPAKVAMTSMGETILPALVASYDPTDPDQEYRLDIIDLIGRIGGKEAKIWLKGKLADPAAVIRSTVNRALIRCGYRAQDDERDQIKEQIRSEAVFATEILALIAKLDEDETANLLLDSLQEAMIQIQARTFDLLSFLYDRHAIHDARTNLALTHNGKKAYALEVLDVVVPRPIKAWLYPLWTDETVLKKVQRLKAFFPTPDRNLEQYLRDILTVSEVQYSVCCKACALYTIATHSLTALSDCAHQTLTAPHPLLRETAVWVLSKLDRTNDEHLFQSLRHDPHPQVARAARLIDPTVSDEGANTMLTTLEKVIALKKTGIFSSLPNEILAAVASLTEEIWFDKGTSVIEKGDMGDCMYFIIQGKVRVHDGDLTLNFLADGDVFGEMAVFDSEPRVASVTSVEDSCFLRLDQEPLYELMDLQPQVAQGLIKTLSHHLRHRIRDLKELQAEREALD